MYNIVQYILPTCRLQISLRRTGTLAAIVPRPVSSESQGHVTDQGWWICKNKKSKSVSQEERQISRWLTSGQVSTEALCKIGKFEACTTKPLSKPVPFHCVRPILTAYSFTYCHIPKRHCLHHSMSTTNFARATLPRMRTLLDSQCGIYVLPTRIWLWG